MCASRDGKRDWQELCIAPPHTVCVAPHNTRTQILRDFFDCVTRIYAVCGPYRPLPAAVQDGRGDDRVEPLVDLARGEVGAYGYAVDAYTVEQHMRLSEQMLCAVFEKKRPFPVVKSLVPRGVAAYNLGKAGVDNRVSQTLLENDAILGGASAGTQLLLQLVSLCFLNVFHAQQLVSYLQRRGCVALGDVQRTMRAVGSYARFRHQVRRSLPMQVPQPLLRYRNSSANSPLCAGVFTRAGGSTGRESGARSHG